MASDMIKLGGLWSGKDKEGNTFLSGKFSPQVKILIFKNKYRESENHPTHIMYLSQVETQGQRESDQGDEFFEEKSFQRGQAGASELRQARAAQGGHLAPEDVPPPQEEYRPAPRQARPTRQPAPPPDFDEGLDDPFADDEAPAPARPQNSAQRTGRNAGF